MTYLKKLLDYKEFSTLVASVASNHNALFKIKENKLSRKAYFYQYILATDSKKSEDFNINMPASMILANATKRNTNDNASYFAHSEKQKQLTPEAYEIQDMLPNNMKSIILSQNKKINFS